MLTVSGDEWRCEGTGNVRVELCSGAYTEVSMCVTAVMPLGFKVILGMDSVKALGGVTVDAQSGVRFGKEDFVVCAAAKEVLKVDEHDFSASFDPVSKCWTAAWKWSVGNEPTVLHNEVERYSVPRDAEDQFETELQQWIADGWLQPK